MTQLSFLLASAVTVLSIAGCKKKAGDGADAIAKMTELRDKMCACKDADCAKKVSDEMTAWSDSFSKSRGDKKLGEDDQKRSSALGNEMAACMMKLMAAPTAGSAATTGSGDLAGSAAPTGEGSGSGSAAPVATGSAQSGSGSDSGAIATSEAIPGLPKQCDDYRVAINKLATCEALPKQARETLVKGYSEAAVGWKALPEAAKEKVGVSCDAAAKAVISTAKGPCGWK
jgi:hypothetical protein